MSPHHRWLIPAASAVKSRRMASARAVAAGSGMVVFFHRLAARPASPAWRISRATRLRECRRPWRRSSAWIRGAPVPALRPFVPGLDEHDQPGVLAVPGRGLPVPGGVAGGTGDLQQLTRPLDVTLPG